MDKIFEFYECLFSEVFNIKMVTLNDLNDLHNLNKQDIIIPELERISQLEIGELFKFGQINRYKVIRKK